MFPNKLNYKIINLTFLLGLLYIAVTNIGVWWGVLLKIISVMAPFIIAFVFAYAFTPFIRLLEKKGLSKNLAILVTVLGLVLLVGGLIAIVLPLFYDQLSLLIKMLKEVIENVGMKFNLNLGSFEIKVTDYLNDALKDIGGIISSTTIDVVSKSIGFASKFIVGFVGFIYFLADMDKIRYWFREMLLSLNRKTYKYFKCLDVEISNYLKGLGIFMLIQLVEYSYWTSKLVNTWSSCLSNYCYTLFWWTYYQYYCYNNGKCCIYSFGCSNDSYLFNIPTNRWIFYIT